MIYRKYLQSVFCIALVLTVLTGCGKNTGQTSRSTEKKEIDIPIILAVDPTSGKKTEQDVVDAFNEGICRYVSYASGMDHGDGRGIPKKSETVKCHRQSFRL
ncbi:MAG: hypothetical protein ACLR2O_01525 [Coprococcus sp.]